MAHTVEASNKFTVSLYPYDRVGTLETRACHWWPRGV